MLISIKNFSVVLLDVGLRSFSASGSFIEPFKKITNNGVEDINKKFLKKDAVKIEILETLTFEEVLDAFMFSIMMFDAEQIRNFYSENAPLWSYLKIKDGELQLTVIVNAETTGGSQWVSQLVRMINKDNQNVIMEIIAQPFNEEKSDIPVATEEEFMDGMAPLMLTRIEFVKIN